MPADPSRGPTYTQVFDQIDLGSKVDDKLFSLEPPAGYRATKDSTPSQYQQEQEVAALLTNSAGQTGSLPLRNARQHLRDLDPGYRVGLVSVLDYQSAVWDVKIREAEQSGSAVDAARVRLDKATALEKLIDAMSRAGLVSVADLHNAQGEVKLRQAELDALVTAPTSNPSDRQSKITAVRLENARQRLNDAAQLFRAGLEPALEYERAKWDVQILEAEQTGDAIKAAQTRLDAATAIAKREEQLYQAGLGTAVDLRVAQAEVKRRQAELDALQPSAPASPQEHSHLTPAAPQAPAPAATQPAAQAAVKQAAGEKISLFVRDGAVQMRMGNTSVQTKQIEITAIGGSVFIADVSDVTDAFSRWVRLRGTGGFAGYECSADRVEISAAGQPAALGGPIPILQNAGDAKAAGAATTRRAATQPADAAAAAMPAVARVRHFVQIVIAPDGGMTFQGTDTTWDKLPAALQQVPDRGHTVLCLAFSSEKLTISQLNDTLGRAQDLAQRFGFEYLSNNGEHPLGSKGEPDRQLQSAGEIIRFGPVHEVTLNDPRTAKVAALNLDTGKTISLPKGAFQAGYEDWLDGSDASVMALPDSSGYTLAAIRGTKTALHKTAPDAWDKLTATQTLDLVRKADKDELSAMTVFPSLPQTAVFQTPRGTVGLVQIIEANGQRHDTSPLALVGGNYPVTIILRYKLVLDAQAAPALDGPLRTRSVDSATTQSPAKP